MEEVVVDGLRAGVPKNCGVRKRTPERKISYYGTVHTALFQASSPVIGDMPWSYPNQNFETQQEHSPLTESKSNKNSVNRNM